MQREVYLEKLDTVQFNTVRVLPELPCGTCPASRGLHARAARTSPAAAGGSARPRPTAPGGCGSARARCARARRELFTGRVRIAKPRLWSPKSPYLYPVKITVSSGGRTVGTYSLKSGVRSVKVSRGRLFLNGRPVNLRGVGVHEDSRTQGFAVDDAFRERLVSEAKAVGATVLRTHYPMHPYMHELADREGLLIWSEIPVYAVKTLYLRQEKVRALAAKEMRRNVETNLNHPSVFTWSVGNELSSQAGPGAGRLHPPRVEIAKDIDPTRPTSIAFAGYPSAGCQTGVRAAGHRRRQRVLRLVPGPGGKLFDRTGLGPYMDQVRAATRSTRSW